MAFPVSSAKSQLMTDEPVNAIVASVRERLRCVRLMNGFKSRRAFAEHLGLVETNYYKEESGQIGVQPNTLVVVARAFRISLDYLLMGDEGALTVNQLNSLRDVQNSTAAEKQAGRD